MRDDWSILQRRFEAFWAGGLHDRPLLAVSAPRRSAAARSRKPIDPLRRWTDPELMVRATLASIEDTLMAGEAMPVLWHNWSAGHALLLGCEPHYTPDTVWVDPAPAGLPAGDAWKRNRWWPWMKGCTAAVSDESRGRYFVMPMWGNHAGDNLALARGSERLMVDLADDRAEVATAVRRVSDILVEAWEELWPLVGPGRTGLPGSINYTGTWSPGRTLGFDCDVSCMVSPRDFEEVFLPPLVQTMRTVDHRIYHLDGPGAILHLDALLEVPELQAVQWVPGDGQPGVLSWIPLIRRIQAAGRGVVVSALAREVAPLLDAVKPEALYINVSCIDEEEALSLLAAVDRRFGVRP